MAIVLRLQQQKQLAQAVLDLAEPYRSVIVARFFDEMSPAQIAHRQGVSVGTARLQAHRGLEMLRAKLDRTYGSRQSWLATMGIAALRRKSTATLWGIVLMKMKSKALLAAAALLAATLGIWFVSHVPQK